MNNSSECVIGLSESRRKKEREKERLRVIVRFLGPSCETDTKHDSTLKEEQMQVSKNERTK